MEILLGILAGAVALLYGFFKNEKSKVKNLRVEKEVYLAKEGDALLKQQQDAIDAKINDVKNSNLSDKEIEDYWNKDKK